MGGKMRRKLYARKVNRVTMLEALSWWAKEQGTTYGKLSASLSQKEVENIFKKYEKLCEERQKKESLRLGWQWDR